VGPSGAGKTTLFALLERFYDPLEGSISFAGRDLRAWPRAELRAAIAYVEQEARVLAGTLRDNLLYAAPEATEDELRAAVTATRLDGLVDEASSQLDAVNEAALRAPRWPRPPPNVPGSRSPTGSPPSWPPTASC
jgi:ABC-type multidrug transport system fused ATPase/permease subunit